MTVRIRQIKKLRKKENTSSCLSSAALAGGAGLATVPPVRETGKPVKANLSLDSGVLAALDAEAARRKLTRSAFVEMLARTTLRKVS